ncbi:CheR family methyltransferase [Candidatus Viridilinea mediisalina]|uniref:Protein-glutamate O-methyltransferase n=1 Tax=Candidatus Viridilinea mediisalina TaxID=2024553 RepID=A0A2A6RHG7_9CHLR|nr:protein-glutamate O-methyltransferase CheR [Candidatus Viridilinea mediisalina]PDW02329.1 protein-glutamate O-methyltransferase [Candidatus Viridilinea mediisalina]
MSTPAKPELLTPRQISALRDLLAAYCGVYLDETRNASLAAATQRRATILGQTPQNYVSNLGLSIDRAELQRLAELLLNHETQFFRNRPHMQALRQVIIPELHQRLPPGAPLRLWSAGCATGEEPYSLAITALEAFNDRLDRPVEVWATDLSTTALERAHTGIYKGRSLANLNSQQRARYFTARGAELAVAPRVRELVHFEQLNLLEPFPTRARGVHIIFCQNVTIYFQVQTCRMLMERFYQNLDEGGSLFLGFSETLWNIFDRFRWREVEGAFVYYKASMDALATPLPPSPSKKTLEHQPLATLPTIRPRPKSEPPAQFTPRPPRPPRPLAPISHPAASEIIAQGQTLLDAGQTDAALAIFYSAPLVGAHAPQILALAARAHADRGDLDLAAAEARRALELNPLTTEAHLLIGLIHARQGRPAAAITQLERARTLDSESPLILFHLAECYRQIGRASEALRDYRTTMRKLATHPPDKLIDGVAAGWLSETCRRYVAMISGEGL